MTEKMNFVLWTFKISHLLYVVKIFILHAYVTGLEHMLILFSLYSADFNVVVATLFEVLVHAFCVRGYMGKNRYQIGLSGK